MAAFGRRSRTNYALQEGHEEAAKRRDEEDAAKGKELSLPLGRLMDRDKASLCSNASAASAWKRWRSHERLAPRDFAWSNGEVRPKKKPWSLSGYDPLGPPSVANRRRLPHVPVRPASLSPVKQQHRIAKAKSISPQSLRPSRDQIGIRDPSVSLPHSRAEERTRVPLLWRSYLLQAAG